MRGRRGNYTVLAALGLPVVLGFAALVVDGSRAYMAQGEVKADADAVAHAALISLRNGDSDQSAKWIAKQVSSQNTAAGIPLHASNNNIQLGFWDFETGTFSTGGHTVNAVKATPSLSNDSKAGQLPLLLAPFMGHNYMDVHADNASIAALRTRDTMVVMDVTLSFVEEMDDAKKSAIALLDTMHDLYMPGDRVGLATFVGSAEVMTELTNVEEGYLDMKQQWSGDVTAPDGCYKVGTGEFVCQGRELQATYRGWRVRNNTQYKMRKGITWCSSRGDLSWHGGRVFRSVVHYNGLDVAHAAPDMPHCGSGGGGTNQGAGIDVAIDELLTQGTFGSAKNIVLVSDGEPWNPDATSAQHFGRHPMGGMQPHQFGLHMADEADRLDMNVFSVSFNDRIGYGANQQRAYLRSLTTGLGDFFETPDSEELPAIMRKIGESIPIVLVQ